jgi:hypothetical protein
MATTTTCDVCEATRGTGLKSKRDWLVLQSASLDDYARDFCSLACLTAWLAGLSE